MCRWDSSPIQEPFYLIVWPMAPLVAQEAKARQAAVLIRMDEKANSGDSQGGPKGAAYHL